MGLYIGMYVCTHVQTIHILNILSYIVMIKYMFALFAYVIVLHFSNPCH